MRPRRTRPFIKSYFAKGRDFLLMVVMTCDDDVMPQLVWIETVADHADLEEVYNTARHLLYAACTGAKDPMLVTGIDPISELVDDFLKGN